MKAPVRYHLLAVKSSIIQKKEINADKDVEKREHLYIVGGNVHWHSHYGKQFGGSSKY